MIFVIIRVAASPPSSNGSKLYEVIPKPSNYVLKNVSENNAGKITGTRLIKTIEIVKRKTNQETLLYLLTSLFFIMVKKTSLF